MIRRAALAARARVPRSPRRCGGRRPRASNLFSTDWSDDGGISIDGVRATPRGRAVRRRGADVVVGVAGNADKIVGMPLAGGAKWTFAHPLDARPIVAGSVVVGSGGGEVFALDALTRQAALGARHRRPRAPRRGRRRRRHRRHARAGQRARLGAPRDHPRRRGEFARSRPTRCSACPRSSARIAFVPWANQYVSRDRPVERRRGRPRRRCARRRAAPGPRARRSTSARSASSASIRHIKDASRGTAHARGLPGRASCRARRSCCSSGQRAHGAGRRRDRPHRASSRARRAATARSASTTIASTERTSAS